MAIQIEIDGRTFLELNLALERARDENGTYVLLRGARFSDPCEFHGEACIRLPGDTHVYSPEATGSIFRRFTETAEDTAARACAMGHNVVI